MPKPPPEFENFSVGVPYFLPFATPYRDSWEIFREDPVTIGQLTAMRRQDGQARALYRLMTKPLLSALKEAAIAQVDGEIGGDPESQFIRDMFFAPASMGGMTHGFDRFIKQMLLALFNGFTAWEMVYWVPRTGPNRNKITLRKLDWRPSETLTFLLDGQGEWNGWRQRTFFQGRTIDVKIPKSTGLYYAHEEAERPFYGVSMFESAFYHYDKKVKLYYIAHLAAQRAAVGLRVGTMPPNPAAADKNNFVKGLANLGLAQYMVLPTGDWTVQSLREEGQFDFLGLINHHNSAMSKSVLAPWFDDSQGGGAGDTALVDFGKQDDATFMMMLDSVLEEMAYVINTHIIPRFIDWNFGSTRYPTFRWGPLTAEQKSAVQDTFDKLASAGQQANITPEFMLELERRMSEDFGFDIDYDQIQKEQMQQKKLQQKVAAQQLAQGSRPSGPQGASSLNIAPGVSQSGGGGSGAPRPPRPADGNGSSGNGSSSGQGTPVKLATPPETLPPGFQAFSAKNMAVSYPAGT